MIELIDLHSPKGIALRVSGKIEKADMEKTIGALRERTEHAERVTVYVELEDWTGFTFLFFLGLSGVVAERAFVAERLGGINVAFDDEVGVGQNGFQVG